MQEEVLIYNNKIANLVFGESLKIEDYPNEGDNLFVSKLEKLFSVTKKAVIELNENFAYTVYGFCNYLEGTTFETYENEVRVLCPKDMEWIHQNQKKNMYCLLLKVYVPNKYIKSFKHGIEGEVSNEMQYLENNPFVNTCDDGRRYIMVQLPIASYDEALDTWTYFGAQSTKDNLFTWDYKVNWYLEGEVHLTTEGIKVTLANEEC